MQLHFTMETPDCRTGNAKLTALSTDIGLRINDRLKREKLAWAEQVRLGDLFIEGFFHFGYVDIGYTRKSDSWYTVEVTPKWTELADIPGLLERVRLTATQFAPYHGASIKNNNESHFGDEPWIRSINKLQKTAWRVNQRALNALIKNESHFISKEKIEDNEAKEKKRISKQVEWAFIISKAKKLKDADVFYQAVEADYRGRIYYKESFFNYQGSDLARGLFKFAYGKVMDEEGLWWLAVHTACSFNQSYQIDEIPDWAEADYVSHLREEGLESISVDKFTLEDRVRWTNENMDVIIAAGRDEVIAPEAEKVVSFLAACIEWYDYDCAVASNTIHYTHLPIPVDGSNNGWQHLGAISRDTHTATLVGMVPQEIQYDFYVKTARKLAELTTDSELYDILERMPMKHIRKGITKRGSMTRAYSAGAQKIGENMWFDCRTEDYHEEYGIDSDHCQRFAKILVKAIDQVCPGPLVTMNYLQKLAQFEIGMRVTYTPDGEIAGKEYRDAKKRIEELRFTKVSERTDEDMLEMNELVKFRDSHHSRKVYGNGSDRIKWIAPSGFPVEYTCWQTKRFNTQGTIAGYKNPKGKSLIRHVAQVETTNPDVRGFMCGISPNFVHSLDAAHMALVLDEWHGSFGAVHDSFATHAPDVDKLVNLIKIKFVEMYDVDNFYNYIQDQLLTSNEDLDVEQPSRGALDITEVYDSDYFFS